VTKTAPDIFRETSKKKRQVPPKPPSRPQRINGTPPAILLVFLKS